MCHLLRKRGEAGREVYCDANIFLLVQLNQKTICLPLFSQIYWKVLQYFSKIYWKITVFPSISSRYNGKVLSANGFLVVVHKVLGKWSMREMNLRILGFISNIFGSIYNVFWLKSPVEKPIQIFSLAVDIFSNISLIHFIYCDRQYWKEMRTIW